MGRGARPRGAGLGARSRGGGALSGPLRYPRLSGVNVPPSAPTHPHPCALQMAPPRAPRPDSPHPCALQMAWDPEQQSQEECPVVRVQVLGET